MKIAFAGQGGSGKTTLSSLFTRYLADRGISVCRQWQGYSAGYDTALALVGNKVQGPEDAAFLREHAADDLLASFGHEPVVRAMEQGRPFSLDDLSHETVAALGTIKDRLDAQPRDWARYTRQATQFHLRNARAWASAAAGEDLAGQVDPEFILGPRALFGADWSSQCCSSVSSS